METFERFQFWQKMLLKARQRVERWATGAEQRLQQREKGMEVGCLEIKSN